MKINVRIILIGVMASIVSINAFACDYSFDENPDFEESTNFVQQKPPTPLPTLNKVVDSVATPVEQLNVEIQQSSVEVCPCDVKSAMTSSDSAINEDVLSLEATPTALPEPSPTSQPDPMPTLSPVPKPNPTPKLTAEEKIKLIEIKNYRFQDITIKSGEVVEWKNLDLDMHSATSGEWGDNDVGDLWDSGKMTFGKSFKFKFMEVGEYLYFCRIHPAMKGLVLVSDSGE